MPTLLNRPPTVASPRPGNPAFADWAAEARLLVVLTLCWLGFGLLVLFSASLPVGVLQYGDGLRFLIRQALAAAVGLGLLAWLCRTRLDRLFSLALPVFVVLAAMVWLVKVPGIGVELNGARRWIDLGPLSLQPSELIKPFLLLLAAPIIASWRQLPNPRRLMALAGAALAVGGVLMQPDLGTAALMGLVLWLMAFIGGIPLGGLLAVLVGGGAVAVWKVSNTAYQMGRVTAFLDPWQVARAEGYQLVQSLIAVGSGGIQGTGYGLSAQKASFLPYPYSDFIFSVFCEEFGLIGSVAFVLFLLLFLVVGLRVAVRCAEPSRRLLAAGSTLILVGQAFLHIAVVIGAVPPKGIPLPLVSYGGSGLIASLLCCGLLIRTAREMNLAPAVRFVGRRRPAPGRPRRPSRRPPRPEAASEPARPATLPAYLLASTRVR
ncbi:FtsW/RodA/SpoVE family cell cycle protein [Gloeobacter kilaueensis]|uniref:Probable peptidoglycan glycosyltransferase FtsW n=1 Tax=Gloeobacter kilaueensis (strain ATCC BAA-2537 / CCAP 1431/1 / ULC 316 / JS1) TaxID=1183438 RepID=U5QKW6_GLOK1|nr:putative peptidoglycan glycosyltransferase FtsW [Gloeobacter kilaueensis]AGY58259.1 cell division protein FtsW [Gloeobacter kilaueensis JS1]